VNAAQPMCLFPVGSPDWFGFGYLSSIRIYWLVRLGSQLIQFDPMLLVRLPGLVRLGQVAWVGSIRLVRSGSC